MIPLQFVLTALMDFLPVILVLVSCVIYAKKVKSSEGLLLLIGEIVVAIVLIISTSVLVIMVKTNNVLFFSKYAMTLRVFTFLGSLMFAFGFLSLALKQSKRQKSRQK